MKLCKHMKGSPIVGMIRLRNNKSIYLVSITLIVALMILIVIIPIYVLARENAEKLLIGEVNSYFKQGFEAFKTE